MASPTEQNQYTLDVLDVLASDFHVPSPREQYRYTLDTVGSDIRRAIEKTRGHSRKVVHVYRPSPNLIDKAVDTVWKPVRNNPMTWPFLIITWPIYLFEAMKLRAVLKNNVYVVTDQSVIHITLDHNPPCSCEASTGLDTKTIPFQSIISVDVDAAGRDNCCTTSLDTVRFYTANNIQATEWIIDEPHQVRSDVQLAIEQFSVAGGAPKMNQVSDRGGYAPTSDASQQIFEDRSAEKRVFVACEEDPGKYRILFVPAGGGDEAMHHFQQRVRDVFPQLGKQIAFVLADFAVDLDKVESLKENDKLLAKRAAPASPSRPAMAPPQPRAARTAVPQEKTASIPTKPKPALGRESLTQPGLIHKTGRQNK